MLDNASPGALLSAASPVGFAPMGLVVVGHLALGIGEGRELQSTFFQALGAGGPGTAFWLCAASVGHGNRVAGGRRRRQRLITARILDQREGMLLWRG